MKDCVFCHEANEFPFCKLFLGSQWPYDDRVIYDDRYIYVVAAIGPQVNPYILIIPKRHIVSCSQMNSYEVASVKRCFNYLLGKGGFGERICFFEHGGESSSGSSSIDHCHIHVIDGKYDLFKFIQEKEFVRTDNLQAFSLRKNKEYLLVGEYTKNALNIKVSYECHRGEHQYFRKKIAEMLNSDYWDWKKDTKINDMMITMSFFINASK